jgi:hypothetical protein
MDAMLRINFFTFFFVCASHTFAAEHSKIEVIDDFENVSSGERYGYLDISVSLSYDHVRFLQEFEGTESRDNGFSTKYRYSLDYIYDQILGISYESVGTLHDFKRYGDDRGSLLGIVPYFFNLDSNDRDIYFGRYLTVINGVDLDFDYQPPSGDITINGWELGFQAKRNLGSSKLSMTPKLSIYDVEFNKYGIMEESSSSRSFGVGLDMKSEFLRSVGIFNQHDSGLSLMMGFGENSLVADLESSEFRIWESYSYDNFYFNENIYWGVKSGGRSIFIGDNSVFDKSTAVLFASAFGYVAYNLHSSDCSSHSAGVNCKVGGLSFQSNHARSGSVLGVLSRQIISTLVSNYVTNNLLSRSNKEYKYEDMFVGVEFGVSM